MLRTPAMTPGPVLIWDISSTYIPVRFSMQPRPFSRGYSLGSHAHAGIGRPSRWPRLFSRGYVPEKWAVQRRQKRFNAAAAFQPRIRSLDRGSATHSAGCFNAAAAFQPRIPS